MSFAVAWRAESRGKGPNEQCIVSATRFVSCPGEHGSTSDRVLAVLMRVIDLVQPAAYNLVRRKQSDSEQASNTACKKL